MRTLGGSSSQLLLAVGSHHDQIRVRVLLTSLLLVHRPQAHVFYAHRSRHRPVVSRRHHVGEGGVVAERTTHGLRTLDQIRQASREIQVHHALLRKRRSDGDSILRLSTSSHTNVRQHAVHWNPHLLAHLAQEQVVVLLALRHERNQHVARDHVLKPLGVQLLLELHLVQNRTVHCVSEATLVLANPLPRQERVLVVTTPSHAHIVRALDVLLLNLRSVRRLQELRLDRRQLASQTRSLVLNVVQRLREVTSLLAQARHLRCQLRDPLAQRCGILHLLERGLQLLQLLLLLLQLRRTERETLPSASAAVGSPRYSSASSLRVAATWERGDAITEYIRLRYNSFCLSNSRSRRELFCFCWLRLE